MYSLVRLALVVACTVVAVGIHSAAAHPGADCEWCGAHEAPDSLSSETNFAGPDEPGRRLVLTGTVLEADGRTPAAGVLLYVYNTNTDGRYPTRGDETGNARRHGYLRGWVVTDEAGRYTVHTVKPGSYPGRDEPAHIHITVKPTGQDEYWIDEVLFEGDPLITRRIRDRQRGRGGPGIVELVEDADGTLRARRDVVLINADD